MVCKQATLVLMSEYKWSNSWDADVDEWDDEGSDDLVVGTIADVIENLSNTKSRWQAPSGESEYVRFELSRSHKTVSQEVIATAHATEAFWLLGKPSFQLASNWASDEHRKKTDILAEVVATYYPLEDRLFIDKFASASRDGMTDAQQVAVRGKATALFCYLLSQVEGENLLVELEASGELANEANRNAELANLMPIADIEEELAQSPAALADYMDERKTEPSEQDLRELWLASRQVQGLSEYYARKFGFEPTSDELESFWYIPMRAHKDTILEACHR